MRSVPLTEEGIVVGGAAGCDGIVDLDDTVGGDEYGIGL